jgi:hypothetical protein
MNVDTEEQFKSELRALLRKYNASMSIENDRDGYAEINFWSSGDSRGVELVDSIDWNTRYENGDE